MPSALPPLNEPCVSEGSSASDHGFLLSLSQERILLASEIARRMGQQHDPSLLYVCLALSGPVDILALQETLRAVVRRHASLRTSFFRNPTISERDWDHMLHDYFRTGIAPHGLYLQRVALDTQIEINCHDIRDLEADSKTEAVQNLFQRDLSTPLDDNRHLRLRANLVRLDEAQHILMTAVDHIVSDGWSMTLLRNEIERLYRHFSEGTPAPPQPRTSFPEFTKQQNYALQASGCSQDLSYWETQWRLFGGARLAVGDFPFARTEPKEQSGPLFQTERVVVDGAHVASLRQSARRFRVTLYTLFLASLVTVLRHYAARDKIAVWCHCTNRATSGSTEAMGLFIHRHLMGFELKEDLKARDLVTKVAERHLETVKHEQMPLQHLWRSLHCSPRFADSGIILDYIREEPVLGTTPRVGHNKVTFTKINLATSTPRRTASIGVYVIDYGETLTVRSDYRAAWYPSESIREMLIDIRDVALCFSENPDVRMSGVPTTVGRYDSQTRVARTEMDEFVVLGSGRIPGWNLRC